MGLFDEILYPLLTQAEDGTATEQYGPSSKTLPHQICQVLQVQLLLVRKHNTAGVPMKGKIKDAVFGSDFGTGEIVEVKLKFADGVAGAVGESDSV